MSRPVLRAALLLTAIGCGQAPSKDDDTDASTSDTSDTADTADTAQDTADTAQDTADSAQDTADSAQDSDDTDPTDSDDTDPADSDDTDDSDILALPISNDFEEDTDDVYQGLSAGNWGSIGDLLPNAGAEAFYSANGNSTGAFANLRLTKTLGGTIANRTYDVSFRIGGYSLPNALVYADFSLLRIGGQTGTMVWTATPDASPTGWVTWEGHYTPDPADLGQPFLFDAQFTLDAQHSVVLDGPVTAVPR